MKSEYYSVIAYDCAGYCVGVAGFYDNIEAATQHKNWLLDRNPEGYDVIVERNVIPELKSNFIPDESL